MIRIVQATMLFLMVIVLSACQCQMTGIASSSVPITADDAYTIIGPVESRSGGCVLLGAIPICEDKPSQKCLERALTKSGGDALIEVTQDTTYMLLPYVYPYWTRLKATAIKFERGGAAE